jgi:hypothetical protein
MVQWVPILLAISGGALVAACVVAVRTRHLRERAAGELQAVLSVALEEATRRRHASVSAHHLARALLAIPAIPAVLQPGEISVDALRSALDAALDATGAATTEAAPESSLDSRSVNGSWSSSTALTLCTSFALYQYRGGGWCAVGGNVVTHETNPATGAAS